MGVFERKPVWRRGLEDRKLRTAKTRFEDGVSVRLGCADLLTLNEIDLVVLQVVRTNAAPFVSVSDGTTVLQAPFACCRDGTVDAPRAGRRSGHDAPIAWIEGARNLHH